MSANSVVKIVPIEGKHEVTGSPQIRADEILGEVIISKLLSDLCEVHSKWIGTMGRTYIFVK